MDVATPVGPPPAQRRVLLWLRRDLRVADNPALVAALSMGQVVPVYIYAPEEEGQFQPGRCSRWWLHNSLKALDADFRALGSRLLFMRASDSRGALARLAGQLGAGAVLFNHLYDPISMVRDNEVKAGLAAAGIYCQSFNADILREPWEVLDACGKPFTCFDGFWSAHCALPYPPTPPLPLPAALPALGPDVEVAAVAAGCVYLAGLGIMTPEEEMSNAQLDYQWQPGSAGAHRLLDGFVRGGRLSAFDRDRAKTDRASTSRLSPHIHYGEISVRHIHYVAKHQELEWARAGEGGTSVADFLRQIGYREYSRYLSFHFPFTHERSLLEHLRAVPWRFDQRLFKAWRQGRTGYPLVDAAMRELWGTGWLHNRMRVVAASFMVKNLLLPWQWGLKHYWDAQLDADLESDALGWQYVSGCMADAHDFSYTIDHHTESKRFDPDGNYVRRWLPVLARLPAKYIHEPWTAPEEVLNDAGVELGVNYPFPVISLEESLAALAAADAVVKQCLRTSGPAASGAGAPAAATPAAPEGPFRPATDADPAEAERLFAEHYRNNLMLSDPAPAGAEGSGASEDVQSNLLFSSEAGGSSGKAAKPGKVPAAAGLADDLVSCAPLPADGARSCWAGPATGAFSLGAASAALMPEPQQPPQQQQQEAEGQASGSGAAQQQQQQQHAGWEPAVLTVPPGGMAAASGSGAGTGHATQTGVSLGVVPSMSGGAGSAHVAVPQAARAPRPPHAKRGAPQAGGEAADGAAQGGGLRQVSQEVQCARQPAGPLSSGGRGTETVQQAEAGGASAGPAAGQSQEQEEQGHGPKRPRARSPQPAA